MKFGMCIAHFGRDQDGDSLTRNAKEIEELGYDSIWVSDHIVLPTGDATPYPYSDLGGAMPPVDTPWLDPLTTLAFLSSATSTAALGISVCVLPYRNPVLNAKALATIDVLSAGRLIVGAGAGWLHEEAAAIGVPFDNRGKRTDEHIQILKALWTQGEPVFQGRFYSISGFRSEPKPAQRPHPPVWIGGHEPPALKRAGTLGDGWHAYRLAPEDVRHGWDAVKSAATEAGRDPAGLTLSFRTGLKITEEPSEGRLGLVGTPDQIEATVRKYEGVGVTHMLFDVSYRKGEATMKRFAQEVLPRFR